jgi:hypothetical protein
LSVLLSERDKPVSVLSSGEEALSVSFRGTTVVGEQPLSLDERWAKCSFLHLAAFYELHSEAVLQPAYLN